MFIKFKWLIAVPTIVILIACGGGGDESPAPIPSKSALSATQRNFETAALNGYWVRYDWNLPTTNVAPTTNTHFLYEDRFSLSASPSKSVIAVTKTAVNMASTLAMPNLTQRMVVRFLKNGAIYTINHDNKTEVSYVGNDVVETQYATDGVTPYRVSVCDSWSEPIPLTGQIGSTNILKSYFDFTKSTGQTVNFDFTKSWSSGSAYFTRKSYQKNTVLDLVDWSPPQTYNSAVTPWSGSATTIETMFAGAQAAGAGGITISGILYTQSAGTITNIEGARAWVANNKMPTSVSPVDRYLSFVELGGKIYLGGVVKAGTRAQFIDGVNTTIVNDYDIRLNSTASTSMRQTIRF